MIEAKTPEEWAQLAMRAEQGWGDCSRACAKLQGERDHWRERAKAEAERADDEAELRTRMAAILRDVAVALKGPELPDQEWSWHDLPEVARGVRS
jgi:hypothetical protein